MLIPGYGKILTADNPKEGFTPSVTPSSLLIDKHFFKRRERTQKKKQTNTCKEKTLL